MELATGGVSEPASGGVSEPASGGVSAGVVLAASGALAASGVNAATQTGDGVNAQEFLRQVLLGWWALSEPRPTQQASADGSDWGALIEYLNFAGGGPAARTTAAATAAIPADDL